MHLTSVTGGTSQKVLSLTQDIFTWYCKIYDLQIEPKTLVYLFSCSESSLALPCAVEQNITFGKSGLYSATYMLYVL